MKQKVRSNVEVDENGRKRHLTNETGRKQHLTEKTGRKRHLTYKTGGKQHKPHSTYASGRKQSLTDKTGRKQHLTDKTGRKPHPRTLVNIDDLYTVKCRHCDTVRSINNAPTTLHCNGGCKKTYRCNLELGSNKHWEVIY
jgi:hypothetical protein